MIGRSLRHYRITASLGGGGMGEVWLARDTSLEREVAIDQARRLAQQIADAVGQAHSAGIVHRDLKRAGLTAETMFRIALTYELAGARQRAGNVDRFLTRPDPRLRANGRGSSARAPATPL